MKRSVSPSTTSISRRSTRSATRRKKEEEDQVEKKSALSKVLMATPLLQSLPMVLSSGFLYHHECLTSASTCQHWYHLWKEVEEEFPEDSMVEVEVENINGYCRRRSGGNQQVPSFIRKHEGLLEALSTPQFVRHVFDQVQELKVAAKKGNAAKNKFRQGLATWGVDVRRVKVLYCGSNSMNTGGIHISYRKHGFYGKSFLNVRLDHNLCLWTGIRTWSVYDGKPLWP